MSLRLDRPVRSLYIQPFYFDDQFMAERGFKPISERIWSGPGAKRMAHAILRDIGSLDIPAFLRALGE